LGVILNKKLFVILIVFAVLVCTTVVSGTVSVGVKEGDWIEYDVVTTGTPAEGHNIVFARMEVLEVEGTDFQANVTSEYINGTVASIVRTFNLGTGNVQGWVIIPANLGVGDVFYDAYIGRNITIEGEEPKLFAGAIRTTTYANLPERYKRWDKTTGVFVETIDTLETYTIHATAVATNMWAPHMFGLDQTLFFAVVLVLVVIIIILGALVIRISRKKKMNST
jgi:hypothetical protein